jgi:hypothetical protein
MKIVVQRGVFGGIELCTMRDNGATLPVPRLELISLIRIATTVSNIPLPNREQKRTRTNLMGWINLNWDRIEPIIPGIELGDYPRACRVAPPSEGISSTK